MKAIWGPQKPEGNSQVEKGANSLAGCGHLRVEFLVSDHLPKNSKHPRPNTQPTNVKKKNPPPSTTLGNSQNLWSPRTREKTKGNRPLKKPKKKNKNQKPKKKKKKKKKKAEKRRIYREFGHVEIIIHPRRFNQIYDSQAIPHRRWPPPANQPANQPTNHAFISRAF